MKTYELYQVDSFTGEKLKGNPAGVVTDADGLSAGQMQAIARELNNSETAFILSPSAPDHHVRVRFFTPTAEVPSCGHATIAAHFVRAVVNQLPSCTVLQKIGIGTLPVEVVRGDDGVRVVMTQGAIEFSDPFSDPDRQDIVEGLGLTEGELDERCPIQIVSTGHSKVLIGIRSRETLNALTPDLSRLTKISHRIGCNGYFVFALEPESDVLSHGRMFAPAIGIAEDPVTGNANGPLGAYLVEHQLVVPDESPFSFKAQQGEAVGRPGIVEVSVDHQKGRPMAVRVGGQAVIVFKAQLEL